MKNTQMEWIKLSVTLGVRLSTANVSYLSINQHTSYWENESVTRRNLHQLVWHLEDSGRNQGRKNKDCGKLCSFRAESCGSLLPFLLPLNSTSESFQGIKCSLEPTVGHSCLFLFYPGIHTLSTHPTLLCYSLIPIAMSQDMLPLEDQLQFVP